MTIKRVWLDDVEELQQGSVDVLVEMEDESLWMARFVTIPYLEQQMDYGLEVGASLPNIPAVRYATLETPHVLVARLDMNAIEDVIDNLLEMDVFESVFASISLGPIYEEEDTRPTNMSLGRYRQRRLA